MAMRAGGQSHGRCTRVLIGAHTVSALALLGHPAGVLRGLGEPEPGALVLARVLGARHLLEGLALARTGSRRSLCAAAGVDATHALSMLVLARARPRHELAALASTALATTLCSWALGCALRGA